MRSIKLVVAISVSGVWVTVSAESSIRIMSSLPIWIKPSLSAFQFGLLPIRLGIISALTSSSIAANTSSILAQYVVKSTSTNTGTSPNWIIGANVVEKVQAGVITLQPFGKFKAAIASKHAEDPELTNTPYFLPKNLATFSVFFN